MPRIKTHLLSARQLKRFRDMADLDHSALQVVIDNAELCLGNRGEKLVELGQGDPACVFLLQGEAQLEAGGLAGRKRLQAGEREACARLNALLPKGGRIVAASDGTALLLVKHKYLQAARLEYRQVPTASVGRFGWVADGEISEAEQDWMSILLSSPLFQRMAPGKLQLFFANLQEKTYAAGETVIRGGQRDDYFYILKSGSAEVLLPGRETSPLPLSPGNFFGEGALVGDTVHSATVRMVESGQVCLVHAEHFEKLLKNSLLEFVTPSQLETFLRSSPGSAVVLDVRFAIEYRRGHRPGSLNIPISSLREKLNEGLSREATYLIDFGEDKRSQLAALLMIEWGFNALLIPAALAAA